MRPNRMPRRAMLMALKIKQGKLMLIQVSLDFKTTIESWLS